MTFQNAIKKMKLGYKVTRKAWNKNDFIYLKNDIIFCDGEFSYLEYLRNIDLKAKDWKIYNK